MGWDVLAVLHAQKLLHPLFTRTRGAAQLLANSLPLLIFVLLVHLLQRIVFSFVPNSMFHVSVKVLFNGTSRAVGELGRNFGPLGTDLDKVAQLVLLLFCPRKRLLLDDWVIVCAIGVVGASRWGGRREIVIVGREVRV